MKLSSFSPSVRFFARPFGAVSVSLLALASLAPAPAALALAAAPVSPQFGAAQLEQAGLPVAAVVSHPVANAKGIAYFIPQEHQNPGTSADDPQNNNAVVAQTQIGKIVSYLTGEDAVPYVMMEGYTYGLVPSSTVSLVQNEMQASQKFGKALPELQSACAQEEASSCQSALAAAQGMATDLDRAILLQGGELDDKATGGTFALYGGEDQSLLNQGANTVRDTVYLDDRLSELQSGGNSPDEGAPGGAALGQQSGAGVLQILASLMSSQQPQPVSQSEIQGLEQKGQEQSDPALTQAAQDLGGAVSAFNSALDQKNEIDAKHSGNLPSRSDNPYADVNSIPQIEQLLQQNAEQVQSTIVDARNSAAASNFEKGLAATNSNAGVIIFGSGHSQGLISDLNEEGISVVAIVPQELGTDEATLAAVGASGAASLQSYAAANLPPQESSQINPYINPADSVSPFESVLSNMEMAGGEDGMPTPQGNSVMEMSPQSMRGGILPQSGSMGPLQMTGMSPQMSMPSMGEPYGTSMGSNPMPLQGIQMMQGMPVTNVRGNFMGMGPMRLPMVPMGMPMGASQEVVHMPFMPY